MDTGTTLHADSASELSELPQYHVLFSGIREPIQSPQYDGPTDAAPGSSTAEPPQYDNSISSPELEPASPAVNSTWASTLPHNASTPQIVHRTAPDYVPASLPLHRAHHLYELKTGSSDQTTVFLTVQSRAQSAQNLPYFFQEDSVSGQVEVTIGKDHIQSVDISVIGCLSVYQQEFHCFLDLKQILWAKAKGIDKNGSDQKLCGKRTWPFSFTLPKEVVVYWNPANPRQVIPLPRTMMRTWGVQIRYDIVIRSVRGRFRENSKFQTTVLYLPIAPPGCPSLFRQLAYQEHTPLLGPDLDPQGWSSLEPTKIKGTLFGKRSVDVTCMLSLATPLCYTKGSVIPCAMIFESDDTQALHLLSSPTSVIVRLMRHVQVRAKPPLSGYNLMQEIAQTIWWRLCDDGSGSGTQNRRISLQGEIHLSDKLRSSRSV